MTVASADALVIGAGPSALAIAAALSKENLRVNVLSANDPKKPWPYTYGIWVKEVDEIGLSHLLEYRWKKTVSYFGPGAKNLNAKENRCINHNLEYGLFDKKRLQQYWLNECHKGHVNWYKGIAKELKVNSTVSKVETLEGKIYEARLVVDASGYDPIFLKSINKREQISVQTCYGIVAHFNQPPIEKNQFILMDFRSDHLTEDERKEPPTFLYAMDLGNGKFFLEETSLGLYPPMEIDKLKLRLEKRLNNHGIEITSLEHEELGLYLPMNLPLPDLKQPIIGFGGSASMVHPASGYLVGNLLRRAPNVAKKISKAMANPITSPAEIADIGWKELWPLEMRRKQALYHFGIEKLMRFNETELRDFFTSFFELPEKEWHGFLSNKHSLLKIFKSMVLLFLKTTWSVRWGLIKMQGRELKLFWRFLKPNI